MNGITRRVSVAAALLVSALPVQPQIVLSGNEEKIDLTSGTARLVSTGGADSVSILDFAVFPPRVTHVPNVANTVIGPPSNIAITPDGTLALIADSIQPVEMARATFLPSSRIHILNLQARPPRIVGEVHAGQQPSGMSITPDGRHALVANRAEGSISVLEIAGEVVSHRANVPVCKPELSISDVAIHPSGRTVLATVQKGGYLAVLEFDDGELRVTGQKISVYGQPYRVVITPDGELAVTAGQGFGNGVDRDAISVVDMEILRTAEYITTGSSPETVEISPDGKLLAVALMNGSNLAADNPNHSKRGAVHLYQRKGRSFELTQELPVGAIPEGLAFTSDNKYLVVQCHPAEELMLFEVKRGKLHDTHRKISVPGKPSSIRAALPAKK